MEFRRVGRASFRWCERYSVWFMTIRLRPFYLWVAPLIVVAVAGLFLFGAYQNFVIGGPSASWLHATLGIALIAFAIFGRTLYIHADESVITVGTSLTHRRYDRREVALIQVTPAPFTRRTRFVRPDGSTLFGTSALLWGQDRLESLASYLGVPLEGQI
jgi:hypothetical protein